MTVITSHQTGAKGYAVSYSSILQTTLLPPVKEAQAEIPRPNKGSHSVISLAVSHQWQLARPHRQLCDLQQVIHPLRASEGEEGQAQMVLELCFLSELHKLSVLSPP